MSEQFIGAGIVTLPIGRVYLPTDEEALRFCNMAEDFERKCAAEPWLNRCTIAMIICARAYDLPIDLLQSHERQRCLGELRHKLMAFSRVISPHTNSCAGVARAFNRRRTNVVHAIHKYGAQIAATLGETP